jgi:hypothetical protein
MPNRRRHWCAILHQRGRERLDAHPSAFRPLRRQCRAARRHGCRIAIPAAEDDKVRHWDEDALSYRATGHVARALRTTSWCAAAMCCAWETSTGRPGRAGP